jgi:hypothetical protein
MKKPSGIGIFFLKWIIFHLFRMKNYLMILDKIWNSGHSVSLALKFCLQTYMTTEKTHRINKYDTSGLFKMQLLCRMPNLMESSQNI